MHTQPSLPLPEEVAHSDDIQAADIRLLYSALPISVVINFLLALILVTVQRTVIPLEHLFIWFALLFLVLLVRLTLFVAWKSADTSAQKESLHWLKRSRAGVIATGIVWGIGGIVLSPSGDVPHQVFVSFTLGGLCAGAITSLSIDRISILGFVIPALLPNLLFFISEGGAISYGMATMIVLFLCFVVITAIKVGQSLKENILLRYQAVENESRFRMMLDYSPIAASVVDKATHRVVFANQSYADLIGIDHDKTIGINPWDFYASKSEYGNVLKEIDNGGPVINRLMELKLANKIREIKWILASYLPIEYSGKPMILRWFYDITDRKVMEEQVHYLAYHDPLTKLPNRILFRDRLRQALSVAKREKNMVAVMFLDLDKFKPVNDTYGHEMGDLLLKSVAERIGSCIRGSDSIARIGGDEFTVLLPEVKDTQAALAVAEKIHLALNKPFVVAGQQLHISSSIGVALYPVHADEEKLLIKSADAAMYYAKSLGRNNVQIYRSDME